MSTSDVLRDHLLELLTGGGAHLDHAAAFADLPRSMRGANPPLVPHTPWRLLEHMRIAQHDILEFSRNPDHQSPPWPDGYWPETDAPPDDAAWNAALSTFGADLQAMIRLVRDPHADLLAPFPWGNGQTLAREAMLLADHNAYHIGQVIVLRRALDCW